MSLDLCIQNIRLFTFKVDQAKGSALNLEGFVVCLIAFEFATRSILVPDKTLIRFQHQHGPTKNVDVKGTVTQYTSLNTNGLPHSSGKLIFEKKKRNIPRSFYPYFTY